MLKTDSEISLDEQYTTIDGCSLARPFDLKVFVSCKQLTRPLGGIIMQFSVVVY